jgi:hypothetical protein
MNARTTVVKGAIVTPRSRFELARFELAEAASVFAKARTAEANERLREAAIAHAKALQELLGWYAMTRRKVPEEIAPFACLVPELKVRP